MRPTIYDNYIFMLSGLRNILGKVLIFCNNCSPLYFPYLIDTCLLSNYLVLIQSAWKPLSAENLPVQKRYICANVDRKCVLYIYFSISLYCPCGASLGHRRFIDSLHDKLSLFFTPKQCFRIRKSIVNNMTYLKFSQNKYHVFLHKTVPHTHMISIWLCFGCLLILFCW